MAKTEHYFTQFEPEGHYHVYNRAIDKKKIFASEGNYIYFLRQYDKYLSPLVTTFSYALMGNHFHLGIRIKSEQELGNFIKVANLNAERYSTPHALVAHQFQRFFQSYAMAFNKQQNRVGTLFQTPFKRCAISYDDLPRLILYHHLNPQKHGLSVDFRDYRWTSFGRYLSDVPTKLPRNEVMHIFGGPERYIQAHIAGKMPLIVPKWEIEDV